MNAHGLYKLFKHKYAIIFRFLHQKLLTASKFITAYLLEDLCCKCMNTAKIYYFAGPYFREFTDYDVVMSLYFSYSYTLILK